jgi:putative membrane protein
MRFCEHWGRPEIVWCRGAYTGFFRSRPVQDFVDHSAQQPGVSGPYGRLTRTSPHRRPTGDYRLVMADRQLDTSTRLAVERTRLASERTLMAWIRTSTSLIAFGFTIFKFFQYLATSEQRHRPIVSPWIVGMTMIVLGLTALTLAWFQHRQEVRALEAEAGSLPFSIAGFMSALIAVLGLVALVIVIWRL